MCHRRLINPFLHFILFKCTKYESVLDDFKRYLWKHWDKSAHHHPPHKCVSGFIKKPSGENRILSFQIRLLLCRQIRADAFKTKYF